MYHDATNHETHTHTARERDKERDGPGQPKAKIVLYAEATVLNPFQTVSTYATRSVVILMGPKLVGILIGICPKRLLLLLINSNGSCIPPIPNNKTRQDLFVCIRPSMRLCVCVCGRVVMSTQASTQAEAHGRPLQCLFRCCAVLLGGGPRKLDKRTLR